MTMNPVAYTTLLCAYLTLATTNTGTSVTDCLAPSQCRCRVVYHDRLKVMMSSVDCSHRNLTILPQLGYQTHSKLYHVDFGHNLISSVHRVSIPKVAYLKRLTLAGNSIDAIHDDALAFVRDTLQELDLSNTGFDGKAKPSFLKNLHKLRLLILDRNDLSTLPGHWFHEMNLDSLRVLSLKHCGMESFDGSAFVGLAKLHVLDVRYNKIHFLSGALGNLRDLRSLYADHNHLQYMIDGSFTDLRNLRSLHVSYNKFNTKEALAEGVFYDLNKLHKLDLSHNKLPFIPTEALTLLNKLTDLDLSYNNIHIVMGKSFVAYNLTSLDLSGNPIGNVYNIYQEAFLSQKNSLEYLNLRNIGIKSLPTKQLKYLRKLVTIDLSQNHLSNSELTAKHFTEIKARRYVIQSGGITSIDTNTFMVPRTLPISLDLRDNHLSQLSFITNASDCMFHEVDLRYNPIMCDCVHTPRILYSGIVGKIQGNCANRNGLEFSSQKLRDNLTTEPVETVWCPYWRYSNVASGHAIAVMCMVFCIIVSITLV